MLSLLSFAILSLMSSALTQATLSTPVGMVKVTASEKGLVKVSVMNKKGDQQKAHTVLLNDIVVQMKEYFAGHRRLFDVPLDREGTDFQKKVWKETAKIPYGKTVTYGDIAKKIGHPQAVRAVGTALGKNPVCIVIPCHRVLPKSGGIGSYAYGEPMKKWLLEHERRHLLPED